VATLSCPLALDFSGEVSFLEKQVYGEDRAESYSYDKNEYVG
jgi:hypothetical protein